MTENLPEVDTPEEWDNPNIPIAEAIYLSALRDAVDALKDQSLSLPDAANVAVVAVFDAIEGLILDSNYDTNDILDVIALHRQFYPGT